MKNYKLKPYDTRFKVGTNIRKWRNIKDVKQKDLAERLGLSEAAVSNIENDITNVTLSQLEDISLALDMHIEQLLCDPQQQYGRNISKPAEGEADNLQKQLVKAMIISLQKKDEQLQELMGLIISNMQGAQIPLIIKEIGANGMK